MTDEHKPTLVLTMGLPRAGKSTWARKQGCPIVNPDSIRMAMHGLAFVKECEPYVWAITRTMVRALFIAGHDRVILDATNTSRERRDAWKAELWNREIRIFDTDPLLCKKRAVDTEKEFLVPVIDRMHEGWEEVAQDELGWAEKAFVHEEPPVYEDEQTSGYLDLA